MVKSFIHLVIPDIVLFINYGLVYMDALYNHILIDSRSTACQISGFVMISSISASNVGAVAIAITTKRSLDFKDRKVSNRDQIIYGSIGWLIGIGLSIYYYNINQLGNFKTLYCGCIDNGRLDVSLPVFVVFTTCITLMMYYYKLALTKVTTSVVHHNTTEPSKQTRITETSKTVASNVNNESNQPTSPRQQHNNNNNNNNDTVTKKSKKAEDVIVAFGTKMCIAYYVSWTPVSLFAIFDTSHYTSYPLQLDIIAGWCIKSGCVTTAYIVYALMKNIYDTTVEKQKLRSAISVGNDDSKESKEGKNEQTILRSQLATPYQNIVSINAHNNNNVLTRQSYGSPIHSKRNTYISPSHSNRATYDIKTLNINTTNINTQMFNKVSENTDVDNNDNNTNNNDDQVIVQNTDQNNNNNNMLKKRNSLNQTTQQNVTA